MLAKFTRTVDRLFDRSNHDLSVINSVFTVSGGAVVLIGVQVSGWFKDRPFSFRVIELFAVMLAVLVFYTAAANKRPASSRFLCYLFAASTSCAFPWLAMDVTGHDLAPKYFQLWVLPIGLAAWALARELSILLINLLNWRSDKIANT